MLRAKLVIFTAMSLIDSHTHLYAKEFDADRSHLIEKALADGIDTFLMPNIDSEWTAAMLAVAESYPANCFPMMGLHPCSVKSDYKTELAFAEKMLAQRKYYAIGEMGIDLFWDKTFIQEQDRAFEIQCRWAVEMDLPVVIHSREATDHAISLIQKMNLPNLKGVFHCFTGTVEQAKEIISMGFFLGIGGVSTFKNSGLDKVLPEVSLNHILLETDAPYLAPVPFRGKRNEPAYLKLIAERVATIYNLPFEKIEEATSFNTKILFNL